MSFLAAIQFLTIVPVGKKSLSPQELGACQCFFPLVGLLLGMGLAGLDALGSRIWPTILVSALLTTVLVIATGALHLEGFLDTCDGLFGGSTREQRLAIMRDKNVGAFAVAGGTCLILLKWAALAALTPPERFPTLVLFPTLSRWAMVLAMSAFPYARTEGLGTVFHQGATGARVLVAALITFIGTMVIASLGGLILLLVTSLLTLGVGHLMSKRLGGLTGDTYGAINEVMEVLTLLLATIMASTGYLHPLLSWLEGL
jgi:adenosylcobinamide-GDP ribazoletransferase